MCKMISVWGGGEGERECSHFYCHCAASFCSCFLVVLVVPCLCSISPLITKMLISWQTHTHIHSVQYVFFFAFVFIFLFFCRWHWTLFAGFFTLLLYSQSIQFYNNSRTCVCVCVFWRFFFFRFLRFDNFTHKYHVAGRINLAHYKVTHVLTELKCDKYAASSLLFYFSLIFFVYAFVRVVVVYLKLLHILRRFGSSIKPIFFLRSKMTFNWHKKPEKTL